jgi:hypothetical protein
LGILNEEGGNDDYAVLAAAENLALHLELPAPLVGEILYGLAIEGRLEFSEPPPEVAGTAEAEESTGGDEYGTGGTDRESVKPSPDDRAARRDARRRTDRGEEPTRVQDPHAKDAPAVREEEGEKPAPSPPETGPEEAPGTSGKGP